jgi:hypothetical protein
MHFMTKHFFLVSKRRRCLVIVVYAVACLVPLLPKKSKQIGYNCKKLSKLTAAQKLIRKSVSNEAKSPF